MTRLTSACIAALVVSALAASATGQTVYPTGTTIYDPERSWNGFTVLSPLGTQAVLVIDMNGTVVKRWEGFNNSAGGPARVLPGGLVMAASGARPPHQESLELVRRDFDGKDLWRLVFDNGGSSGYGFNTPIAPDGVGAFARATSRVLEINPVTLELVWSYTNPRFFSTNISGAQRLPNGNTLITAGAGGRLFEVTKEGAIVWEYMFPLFAGAGPNPSNAVYRAYRVPYDWIPQLRKPSEQRVTPPPLGEFKAASSDQKTR